MLTEDDMKVHIPLVETSNEIPSNEIWYTTTDGQKFEMLDAESMGMQYEYTLVSNTYENGIGKMVFEQDVKYLGFQETEEEEKLYPLFYKIDLETGEPVENTLKTIMLPNSVTSIGESAFAICESLTNVTYDGTIEQWNNIFKDDDWDADSPFTEVHCSDGDVSLIRYLNTYSDGTQKYEKNVSDSETLVSTVIQDSVTSIGDYAFDEYTSLTSVTIPNSVTSIGNSVFQNCTSLTSITYNGTVEQWNAITKGDRWNYNVPSTIVVTCSDGVIIFAKYLNTYSDGTQKYENIISDRETLVSTVIQDSVTSISGYAFGNCSGLTSVTIPDSVTSIGYGAFSGCTSLTSIEIPNSVTSIGNYAFQNCSSLTSIEIPNSVTRISYGTFVGCYHITRIEIPNSVTSIEDSTFGGCSRLTSVEIPNSVTSIGSSAFINCTRLTSVTIPNSVTSIDNRVFWGCSSLTSVTIGNSVTSIGISAFGVCSSLTSIDIPNSVTSIGGEAFRDCRGLTSITYNGTVEQWNAITKGSNWHQYVPSTTVVTCLGGTVALD